MTMTTRTQPFLDSSLFAPQLFEDGTNLYIVMFIYIVKSWFLNVLCIQYV